MSVYGVIDLNQLGIDQETFFKMLIKRTFEGDIFRVEDVLALLKKPQSILNDPQIRKFVIETANSVTDMMINIISKVIRESGCTVQEYDNTEDKEKIINKVYQYLTKKKMPRRIKYFVVNEVIKDNLHMAKLMYTLQNKQAVKECMKYVTEKLKGDGIVDIDLKFKNDKIYKFEFRDRKRDVTYKSNFIILNPDRMKAFCKYYGIRQDELISECGVDLKD